uniref:Uncharacterized protein n=1 Tax=Marseillevirus LCMAC102 TaxID=2506603 RepID=A0A481YUR1_9VIRU|nr:MAG: uncharacterized protein LCMAC102_04170 [Marseillevirus LCMAC102]
MTTTTSNIFDRGVQKILNAGFRPQLFLVTNGSYASNGVYGSSAASVANYDAQTLQTISHAEIRQHDRDADFSLKLVLDLTLADPQFGDTYELRVRTLQPLLAGLPGRYLTKLPVQDLKHPLPLFLDVEMLTVDPTGVLAPAVLAGLTTGKTAARMLYGSELALVIQDHSVDPTTEVPVTDTMLNWSVSTGRTQLCITIRGTYRGEASPNP